MKHTDILITAFRLLAIILSLGILCCYLAGCRWGNEIPAATTSADEEIKGSAMTETELAPLRNLYEADFSLYSQALTSYFKTPEEINLQQFFYNGHMDCRIHPETCTAPTEEEIDYLKSLSGADHPKFCMDATVISREEMDEDLMEVFGLTLDQTNQTALEAFDYVPQTHRYFLFKGDTNSQIVRITDGIWLDDHRAELHYLGGFNEVCSAVMEQRNEHWYIVSNSSSFDFSSLD